jgi:hypothetical protein
VATSTGNRSVATNTGDESVTAVTGKGSVAISLGRKGRAKGALGCWLILAEKEVKCIQVDGAIIKADTFYTLENGEFKEEATEVKQRR